MEHQSSNLISGESLYIYELSSEFSIEDELSKIENEKNDMNLKSKGDSDNDDKECYKSDKEGYKSDNEPLDRLNCDEMDKCDNELLNCDDISKNAISKNAMNLKSQADMHN